MRPLVPATLLLCLFLAPEAALAQAPPYSGTIFVDRDIVTPEDPTVYQGATYLGRGVRTVYDRRASSFISMDAYLAEIAMTDGTTIEAQVNPEFGGESAAMEQAALYGRYVGQLPAALRRDVDALWIHQGTELFGGGNRSILIHTGQTALYLADGVLEETLIHEAAHSSLDADHAASGGWLAAQAADPTFISTYARDNPTREDIAESVLMWLAVRYQRDRISDLDADRTTAAIPNRLAYFDAQNLDLRPLGPAPVAAEEAPASGGVALTVAPNPVRSSATFRVTLSSPREVRIEIHDVLGRTVSDVPAQTLASGETAISWDTRGLPSGAYVARVIADGATVSHRIVVLD